MIRTLSTLLVPRVATLYQLRTRIAAFSAVFGQYVRSRRYLDKFLLFLLLITQAALLGYSATLHSPTQLEPAFLVSGISHWQFRRFELYRANPPLVRMIAALPSLAVGFEADWSRFFVNPGGRPEFSLGEDFIKANGPDSIPLFVYGRWACIPLNMLGAYFAYRWAKELYGDAAGIVALTLYVFEPNLLAHGELITSDGACTGLGIMAGYAFWRWLKQPTWLSALFAGTALGLAELTKMTWTILFGVWPILWILWRWLGSRELRSHGSQRTRQMARGDGSEPGDKQDSAVNVMSAPAGSAKLIRQPQPTFLHLAAIMFIAIYVINLGYGFDGIGARLDDFQFVSSTFTGSNTTGNRFRNSWLGSVFVPLPKEYVLGIDAQRKDFEQFHEQSFLRGEWKNGGWWYYYIYGLLVKVPCGTWGLLLVVVLCRLRCPRQTSLRDELVLLLPAFIVLLLVSSQTAFNIHLRYVFPTLGLVLIFAGQCGSLMARDSRLIKIPVILLLFYSVLSTAVAYPNHLAYFNDFVGGPKNGHHHLLGSSLEWGQDLLQVRQWLSQRANNDSNCFLVMELSYDARDLGLSCAMLPLSNNHLADNRLDDESTLQPVTYLVSQNFLARHRIRPQVEAVNDLQRLNSAFAPSDDHQVFNTIGYGIRVIEDSTNGHESQDVPLCGISTVTTRTGKWHCTPREMTQRTRYKCTHSTADIQTIVSRIRPDHSPMSASHCLHILATGGIMASFDHETLRSGQHILKLFTDSEWAQSYFGGAAFQQTRYGVRPSGQIFREALATESHSDQTLVVLSRAKQPLAMPLKLGDKMHSLSDLLADSVASFAIDQSDLEWAVLAYAAYLPADAVWENKFGQAFRFNDVGAELLSRDLRKASSCCGCHIVEALTWVLALDREEEPILSSVVRKGIRERLQELLNTIESTQYPDGSWGPFWYDLKDSDGYRVRMSESGDQSILAAQLLATSHLVIWIQGLPDDFTIDDSVVERASEWIYRTMSAVDDQFLGRHFCPCSHGALALKVMSNASGQ